MPYKDPEAAKEYQKRYWELHKEEKKRYLKEYRKQYRELHKEELKEKRKKYHELNKERDNEQRRKYYEEHKEHLLKYSHRYRSLNPDKVKKWKRKNSLNYLDLTKYKWEDVEGYDGWTVNVHCHHRLEELGFSVAELKARGLYFNRPADELICLTKGQHTAIHNHINPKRGNR